MQWFPVLVIIHYTVFLSEIFLIISILYLNRASVLNRVAVFLIACFALWSLGEVFLSNPNTPQKVAEWVSKIYSIGWLFFSSFSILFALLFIGKTAILNSKIFSIVILFFPIFFYVVFWTGNLQYPLEKNSFGWAVKWKYNIFTFSFYFYYILSIITCIWLYLDNAIKSANPIRKRLSFIMVFTMSASLLCGTYMQIILSKTDNFSLMIASITDISVVFWIFGLFYSISRYRFMSLTPATTTENIIDNMSEALIILDEFFVVTFFNNAALKLLGCVENDLKNKPFVALFADSSISNYWLKTNITKHVLKGYETFLSKKDDSKIPVLLSSSVIFEQDDIVGVICIVSDMTLQKQAEKELKKSFDRLIELDRMKESFLSMVSHELRTPLTSIKGFLSFLLSGVAGQITPRQKEFLEIMDSNSDRLLTMTGKLLDVSKMTSGSFSIQKADYDIIKVMESSVKDISSIIEKKKITLLTETPIKNPTMKIDEYRISQAIINLLNNAIKFSSEGTKIVIRMDEYSEEKIKLPAETKACLPAGRKYVVISVADEGVGLTPEQKQKVFGRFYQAEDINIRSTQGSGLGLYITKNIVELHEGFIWVESEGVKKGTTFYILLPVA